MTLTEVGELAARRRRVLMLLALSVVALAGALTVAGRRAPSPSRPKVIVAERPTPVLLVAHRVGNDTAEVILRRAIGARTKTSGAFLALSSLSAGDVETLRGAFDEVADRLEIARNPLVVDLEDEPRTAALDRVLPLFSPTFTAADALVSDVFVSGDGDFAVAIAPACGEPRAHVRCLAAWDESIADEDARRARFFAWPLAGAAVIAVVDPKTVVAELRGAVKGTSSRIALVARGDLGAEPVDGAALPALRASVDRLLDAAGNEGDDKLAQLRAMRAAHVAPPTWLSFGADEVLIVPRLSTVATLRAFVDEVDAALTALPSHPSIRWVHRPRP